MKAGEDILKQIVHDYKVMEDNKHFIENKTAIVMVNLKFVENMRHSYSHLIAGFFYSIGAAEICNSDALKHFQRGRTLRTENKRKAMDHFVSCIDACRDGLREIGPIDRKEKGLAKITIATFAFAVIATIIAILSFYK